jgi:pilus assembly protein CpaB
VKKKKLLVMLIQLIVIIVFSVSMIRHVNKKMDSVSVYVFTGDLTRHTLIEDSNVRTSIIPVSAVSNNMITKKEDIMGKFTKSDVYANTFVYTSQLTTEEEIDPFALIDFSNYRKISIPVNFLSALSGSIKRGDKIDMMFVGDIQSSGFGGAQSKYSETFLQGVLVYEVNTGDGYKFLDKSYITEAEAKTSTKQEITASSTSSEISILTLLVTPEQAEEIAVRRRVGTIELLGRFEESIDSKTLGFTYGEGSEMKVGSRSVETRIDGIINNPVPNQGNETSSFTGNDLFSR